MRSNKIKGKPPPKNLIGLVTFIVLTICIIYATIVSASLNAELQITGEGLFKATPASWEFPYTGGVQTFTATSSGIYTIELWGAQGGSTTANGNPHGGYGGYTKGNIFLNSGTTLYIYIGGVGITGLGGNAVTPSGWNGGGSSRPNATAKGAGGGGASDIRFWGTGVTPTSAQQAWNDATGLRHRIMVAGGGGGAGWDYFVGGAGGGLSGLRSPNSTWSSQATYNQAWPGTQTAGGTIGSSSCNSPTPGQFGIGGNGVGYSDGGGGGGGGYYGGGGACIGSGGGGSSYISGHIGAVALSSSSANTAKAGCAQGGANVDCSIHYSNLTFTNTLMIDGWGIRWTNVSSTTQLMPNPSGGTYASGTGRQGNGYGKITH